MKNIIIAISLIIASFGLNAQVNGCFGYLPPAGPPSPPLGDDQSIQVNLPFTFCFYGTNYTSLWINDNGTVSFDQAHGGFTAAGFPMPIGGFGAQEIIAPFWADFHQNGALSGPIYYQTLPNAIIIHWDGVGYYSSHDDKLNTMMLILTDGASNLLQPGANVGFFYEDMQWTTGDASGGTNGFGGTPATVGVNRGNGADFIQLGRFDAAGTGYDGPFNTNDSVSWLDNKSFMFNICSSNNIAPIVAGIDICDTLRICIGETLPLNVSFLAPEANQLTWAEADTSFCDGFQITNTVSGTNSTAQIDGVFTASMANIGIQTISFMAYDNGTPSDTIEFDYIIKVDTMPYLPVITGDTSYCAGTNVTLDAGTSFFDSYLWTTTGTNQTTTATQGNHSVTVTLNGCSYTTPPYVVTEIPAVNGSLDSTICFGDSFVFNGTTYNGVNNTGNETLSTSLGCDSIVAVTVTELPQITNSVNYTICFRDSIIINGITYNGFNNFGTQTLTAANGCDSILTISVNEDPLITGILDTTICFGDVFMFNGTSYSGSNLFGTETLIAVNGCDSVVTVSVQEEPFLKVEIATPDTISCGIASITLYGTATSGNATNFAWTTPNGSIISPNLTDSIAEVNSIGDYTLNIINNFGCTADSTITVYENFTTPITSDLVTPLCDDIPGLPLEVTIDLTTYDDDVTNFDGVSVVEWFYDGALTNPIPTPTNFTTSSVTYFILATNPVSKCTDSAKVELKINFTPQVNFSSDTVCQGFTTSFSNNSIIIGTLTSTYWDFGDGSFSKLYSPGYIFTEPGIHNISLTMSNDKGCTENFTKEIEVFANPIAQFSMNPNPATMLNSTVNFQNLSTLFTAVDSFNWEIGEIAKSMEREPTYSFSEDTTGKHIITLNVTDINGCKDSIDKILSITGNNGVYMPSGFSPNGDGLNDIFKPNGFGISDNNFSFLIFDRWGTLIFESNNKNFGWDGTYKGESLPTGSYIWKITYLDYENVNHSEMGNVNVIK
ncbi:MAG: gliding motility-associated C-terminal domain-containing protein [Vicingaceae bacterium]|nr:gliding motility-associated C-terminal domain-containing protein [Vicingaceae bacterium]